MTATAIVGQIVTALTAGITGIATGIGSGLSSLVQAIAFTGTGDSATLSPYFVVVLAFAGVSLAIGLCRKVVGMVGSLGARH